MSEENKTIFVISGCSWSVGEWSEDCKTLQHGGLAQYMSDHGHNVINVGQSSSANRESLLRVRNLFFNNPHLREYKNKEVIVFQTEWTRDFAYMDPEDRDFYDQPMTLMHRLISRFYYDLSALSKEFSLRIKVIGGAGDALGIDDFETIYPGVEIICQSFVNLLLEGSSTTNEPVFSLFSYTNGTDKFLKLFKDHVKDSNQLEAILNEADRGQQRANKFLQHKEYFFPDGAHPNRLGHNILYNYLEETIFNDTKTTY